MEINTRDGGLDRRIMHNIRFHARRMAYGRIIPGMEVEDYEQDLVSDLLQRRNAFDPARASFRTFADRIIAHRVSTLAQPTSRAAAERRLISLDAVPDPTEGDEETLIERLSDPAAPLEEQLTIGIDVRRFVAALPPSLIHACTILLDGSITDGARDSGISRSTVHERITTIRRRAVASGLGACLPRSPDGCWGSPVRGGEDPWPDGPMDTAMPNKPPRIHLLISESELRAWLAHAVPGDRLDYHRGVLAADRLILGSRLPERDCAQLNRIADLVFGLAAAGRVHLLQRRNGPGDYAYMVVAGSAVRTLAGPTHCRSGDQP